MSFRESISGRPATIKVGRGPHPGLFTVQKSLLCNSSAYFKAALCGSFIEGQTQTIDLDDEDPSVFRTYIAWLYQGHLNSQDIEEDLDDPQDFGLHMAEVIVFADKRDIPELKNDATSMLLDYLKRSGLATLETINCIYNMPKSAGIHELRRLLAHDEVWFGHRLENAIDHWHPEFMAMIIKIYKKDQAYSERMMASCFTAPGVLCQHLHKHTLKAPTCSSLARNVYIPAPSPVQQPPNKKRKTIPSPQTAELLDD